MTKKKNIAFLLTIMIALTAAGCGEADEPVAPAYEGMPEIDEGVDNAEPYEAAPSESSGGYGGSETGTIVYYDELTLIICTRDDRNLNLFVEDGEVDKSETRGLDRGSEVDVYYTGVIKGGDTSAAQVTKLAQSQSQAAVRTDVSVMGGIILESDGATLRIATLDGDELTFLIGEDVDKSKAKELETGGYVTVFYEGGTAGAEAGDVTVIKLVQ